MFFADLNQPALFITFFAKLKLRLTIYLFISDEPENYSIISKDAQKGQPFARCIGCFLIVTPIINLRNVVLALYLKLIKGILL